MNRKKLKILPNLAKMVFQRVVMVGISILAQIAVFVLMIWYCKDQNDWFYWGLMMLSIGATLFIISKNTNPAYKIAWLVPILLFPVFGGLFYLLLGGNRLSRRQRKKMNSVEQSLRRHLPQNPEIVEKLKLQSPSAAVQSAYIQKVAGCPIYDNTTTQYFPLGDEAFPAMLEEMRKAEKYIFLEYFIIGPGVMWDSMLEILKEKAAAGLDVRVMYDGTCEFSTLPRDYPRRLEALGIRCKVFAPVTPFVSTHYNYRDHRKILVVDGRVGFTGGVNLADEYINHIEKYGRWKDAAVMLEGEGVRTMTALFLQMWSIQREPEFAQFLTHPLPETQAKGFVTPYGDCPLDGERVGEMVYIDLLNRARHSVHIITPYPHSGRRVGDRPALCRRARRGCASDPARQAGQGICLCAGQDPLPAAAVLRCEDQRVDPRLHPRQGDDHGRAGGRCGHHQSGLPQPVPPF